MSTISLTPLPGRYGRSKRRLQTSEPWAFHRLFMQVFSTLLGRYWCCNLPHCLAVPQTDGNNILAAGI